LSGPRGEDCCDEDDDAEDRRDEAMIARVVAVLGAMIAPNASGLLQSDT